MQYVGRVTAMVGAALLIMLLGAQVPQDAARGQCPTLTTPVFAVRDTSIGTIDFALTGAPTGASSTTTQLGARFTAAAEPGPGLIGVHLLVRGSDHLYTTSSDQIRGAIGAGYTDRGQQFWVTNKACGTEVHRFTKNGVSNYAITSGDKERLSSSGWADAGVAFRAAALSVFNWPTVTGKGPLDLAPYSDPDSLARKAYRSAQPGVDRQTLYQLAATPTAIWLGPSNDIRSYVDKITSAAAAQDEAPQFVLYAIPDRDCGGYASGGLPDAASYRRWVDGIRTGLEGRPAVLIVEPDAIGMSCLSAEQANERVSMLRYAMETLSSAPNVWVYIHAGSAGQNAQTMAASLIKTGIAYARGFAVNVSGFDTTESEIAYGKQIVSVLNTSGVGGKHFVVDTSRNGVGRPPEGATGDVPRWCNPRGRALGSRPTPMTGDADVDALLWIKPPGETDGPCYSGDPAHGWFNSYALGLVTAGLQRQTIADIPAP